MTVDITTGPRHQRRVSWTSGSAALLGIETRGTGGLWADGVEGAVRDRDGGDDARLAPSQSSRSRRMTVMGTLIGGMVWQNE